MADEDIDIDINVTTGDAAAELDAVRDKSRAAGEALDTLDQTDIDIDTSRAAGALEDLDRKGRGMADGVGFGNNALRDLTGPLGDAVGPAGDLGDAFEGLADIAGGLAAKLGVGEEAIGKLTGAVAGVGVVVAAGVAAWSLYRNAQKAAEEQARKLYEIQEQLADGKLEEAAAGLAEEYGGTIKALRDLGYESGQIVGILRGQTTVIGDLDRQINSLTTQYDAANLAAAEGSAAERDRALALREQIDELVTLQTNLEDAQTAWADNEAAILGTRDVTDGLVAALGGVKQEADNSRDAIDGITEAFNEMTEGLDAADAIENVRDAFDGVEQAALDAWTAAQENAPDAEAKMRDYEQSVRDALREVGGLGDKIDGLPPETIARIFAEVQQGDLDEAKRILDDVESNIAPIRLQIDLADLEKQAFVAAARARNAAGSGGSGGSSPAPAQGSVGYQKDSFSGGTTNVYYPPRISPTEQQRAQTAYRRVNG